MPVNPNLSGAARLVSFVLASSACASQPHYVEPTSPAAELAGITLDERAKVLTLEDLPVDAPPRERGDEPSPYELHVEPGCRTLTAKYEESYFVWGEKKAKKNGEASTPSSLANLGAAVANSESHDYQTTQPIRFYFDAKAGHKYWVTASFTGDQFLPRLVELDPSGEASATFLPDAPCGKK